MWVRILGGLGVLTRTGAGLDLGTPKQRTVCAMLLAWPNQLVTIDQLVDELWPDTDRAPRSAVANTRTYAANLRRLFRAANLSGLRLESRRTGYLLHVDPDKVDMLVFKEVLRCGRAAAIRGDRAAAGDHFDRAAELWGGQPFEDVGVGPVLTGRRAMLAEEYVTAVEDRAEVMLGRGREKMAIPLIREHVHTYRTRERGWELLMIALHRTGDVAGALAAYVEARTALVDQLGVEPGARLRALQQTVLQGAPARDSFPAAAQRPTSTPESGPPPPRCLPRPIGDFTGRDELVAQLVALLSGWEPALVAIDGMAGAGKTTLAVHAATRVGDRYPDGHLYLDLHGHSESAPIEPATALSLLLGQMGVAPTHLPNGLEERSARWRTEVAHRRMLVLLDNAADSRQVAPLLPGASPTAVLVTSRRRLGALNDARHISLDLLQPAESVRLLARAVGEDCVSASPETAAEVARLCGHLPLALRIAGARLASRPSWTVADLAERLRSAKPAMVDLAVEGSTVAAAFALSYRNLPPPVQRMFRRLGQYPGIDLDEHAAAAMADSDPATARDLLEELVDVHLLEQPATSRYRLHDLLRDFARRVPRSTEPDDDHAGLTRLVDHYTHSFVNASTWLMRGLALRDTEWGSAPATARDFSDHGAALPWLAAEWRNALAIAQYAFERRCYRRACTLSLALWPFMLRQGHIEHLVALQERLASATAQINDHRLSGWNHHYLAGSYARLSKYDRSIPQIERALDLWRAADDQHAESYSINNYVGLLSHLGRFDDAIERGRQAIRLAEAVGDAVCVARSHLAAGLACRMVGAYDAALRHLRPAAARFRSISEVFLYPSALVELGQVHGRLGHLKTAAALLARAGALKRAGENAAGAAEALSELGVIRLRGGRPDEALACQQKALANEPISSDPHIGPLLHNNYSQTLCTVNDLPGALEHGRIALKIAENGSYPYEQARAHSRIAAALVDDPEAALGHWQKALAMHAEMGTPERHEAAEEVRKLTGIPPDEIGSKHP